MPLPRPCGKIQSAGSVHGPIAGTLFYGLDGRASQRTKAVIEGLLEAGGHANQP